MELHFWLISRTLAAVGFLASPEPPTTPRLGTCAGPVPRRHWFLRAGTPSNQCWVCKHAERLNKASKNSIKGVGYGHE
jgi:hypothetical protein